MCDNIGDKNRLVFVVYKVFSHFFISSTNKWWDPYFIGVEIKTKTLWLDKD